jgi:hypothetical protein
MAWPDQQPERLSRADDDLTSAVAIEWRTRLIIIITTF